jgi:hypothetical protein
MPNFPSKNEGTWFYFDSIDESIGGVCLRIMAPSEEDRINKLTTKKTRKPIRGVMTLIEDTNEKLRNELLYDYWIVDWKNIQLDGKKMECDKTNKLKMMEVPEFAKFILDKLLDLNEQTKSIDEARVKNLENISSGGTVDSHAKDV